MAVRFESTADRITIVQTRRVLRAIPVVLGGLLLFGVAAIAVLNHYDPAAGANGPSVPFLAAISLLGWAIIVVPLRPLTVEIRAVLDRKADRIAVHCRGWLMRPWHVERKLHDVARIDLRVRTVAYGFNVAHVASVFAIFTDGGEALLWLPAFATSQRLTERVSALRAFMAPAAVG